VLSREWFRTNPPLPFIRWGPRNNTNIQQSAVLLSLEHVARNRQLYLENYWLKNKRAVAKGKTGPVHAWVIPANQRRKADAAIAVNDLRRQGLEISRATTDFKAGNLEVRAGDYVVRGDQPFRTLADMYFSIQNYPPQNPSPYDDTGWTFQLMRDLRIVPVNDGKILEQPMTLVSADVRAAGGIAGRGRVVVVDHTADTALVTFRFRNASLKMLAAEADFEVDGRAFKAGAVIVPDADVAKLGSILSELGLSAWALDAVPKVRTHELDVPRIGYVHSWTRTQDEGWWRAAFDTYGIPYTYFADQRLREGRLRSKYDVIVFPHVGGSAVAQVNGMARSGSAPLPYKKTSQTPNLGALDSSDDIRGGMGIEGLAELLKFVQEGGTLITEGSTATIFPAYGLTSDVTVEEAPQLFARGTILRGRISDPASPIAYGYGGRELPVYFNQSPVLRAGGAAAVGGRGGAPNAGMGQTITPNANRLRVSPFQPEEAEPAPVPEAPPSADDLAQLKQRGRGAPPNASREGARARVVVQFASDAADLLLSGTLANGQALTNRAVVVDNRIGDGHLVMFATRPFWRWQTHGTYTLGFNAIMNWNDLDAR
jgi:hypothetical protein